jgi:hypothetical protein
MKGQTYTCLRRLGMLASISGMRRRAAAPSHIQVANCLRYRFNPLAHFEREHIEFRVSRLAIVATSASVS